MSDELTKITVRILDPTMIRIAELAREESRSVSNMFNVLLSEALAAHVTKGKEKSDA